jgi:hypothetical protein
LHFRCTIFAILQRPKAKVKKESDDAASQKDSGDVASQKLEDHGAADKERKHERK